MSQVSLVSGKVSHQVSLMSGKPADDVKEGSDIPSRMSSASLMAGKPLSQPCAARTVGSSFSGRSSRSQTVGRQRTLLLGKLKSRLAGLEEEAKQVIVGLEMLENNVKDLVEEAKLAAEELDSEGIAMDRYSVISQHLVQVEDEITMISASLNPWLDLSSESEELDDSDVSYVEVINNENTAKEVILGENEKNGVFVNEEKVEALSSITEMSDICDKAKHVLLEDKVENTEEMMAQKLHGNSEPVFPQKRQDDSPVTPIKIPEVEEQLECKTTNFREDVAYTYSCSLATGLHMIEATSALRNYVFTIGDRSVIARFLAPLVKDLVIVNKIGGLGKKSILHIGVVVESHQQFFCAIKAANAFFKPKGFKFIHKHSTNGIDVLHFLSEYKVIPKVDCNGMYQITVKFNLPKGNEKKVDASLGRQLEKEVRGCGVEKISFGLGERILLMGHVKDAIKVSKKVKEVFEIIPSKHTWNNEPDMSRISSSKIRRKQRKAIGQRLDLNLPTI